MKTFKNLLFSTIALTILLTTTSCDKNHIRNCDEHDVSACDEDPNKVNLRIKNVSEYDFCNVVLFPPQEGKNYGIVGEGETTCYRSFDVAYDYASIELYIGEKYFGLFAIDYVGETPLSNGNYTYSIDVVDFENGIISLEME